MDAQAWSSADRIASEFHSGRSSAEMNVTGRRLDVPAVLLIRKMRSNAGSNAQGWPAREAKHECGIRVGPSSTC
jgi:hypothetical protein